MNPEIRDELIRAASLLEKAASLVEYNVNLQKEASATTDALIAKGIVKTSQRDEYTDYLMQNPEKIASMRSVLSDLPGVSDVLGEPAEESSADTLDSFDRELLGF